MDPRKLEFMFFFFLSLRGPFPRARRIFMPDLPWAKACNKEDNKVKTFLLDCDCTDENTSDVASAIVHSLNRTFLDAVEVKVAGQCTDSGGGGTKLALQQALQTHNVVVDF